MPGNELKIGKIKNEHASESELWECFNYVFSDSCPKTNSYKYGLIKSILDNLFNAKIVEHSYVISYTDLFSKFTENYWNLVGKYKLRQNRPNKRNYISKIETIINKYINENSGLENVPFDSLSQDERQRITDEVSSECRKYVIGALYEDLGGCVYSFDKRKTNIEITHNAYEFMLKYKVVLEKNNYYSWAKFLEHTNSDNQIIRVIDKLELATPKRKNLSIYRRILEQEFEINNCFYCGKRLNEKTIHVDHFIPWSFVKDDKIWNFVLSCSECNKKKSDNLPKKQYIIKIEEQNRIIRNDNEPQIQKDFESYADKLIPRIWEFARMSGLKEMH